MYGRLNLSTNETKDKNMHDLIEFVAYFVIFKTGIELVIKILLR